MLQIAQKGKVQPKSFLTRIIHCVGANLVRRQLKITAAYFGIVLGLTGIGQAWHMAHVLWNLPAAVGKILIVVAVLSWTVLIVSYLWQAVWKFEAVKTEFLHPVQGSTPALIAVSTLLISIAVIPYSTTLAWCLAIVGIAWHMTFSLWHTGGLWQGGRRLEDMAPTIYLPAVAGNFTSAAALGSLGHPDWGWLFLGAGLFSWIALESLVIHRLCFSTEIPVSQRPLVGIQFAPPVVCAMAWLALSPGDADHWLLMLWGYGLVQLLIGIRLVFWLGRQPFTPAYWAYTFGIAAAAVDSLKLAKIGVQPAQILAFPIFIGANIIIGFITIRTVQYIIAKTLLRPNKTSFEHS